jgi:hypothetical protein
LLHLQRCHTCAPNSMPHGCLIPLTGYTPCKFCANPEGAYLASSKSNVRVLAEGTQSLVVNARSVNDFVCIMGGAPTAVTATPPVDAAKVCTDGLDTKGQISLSTLYNPNGNGTVLFPPCQPTTLSNQRCTIPTVMVRCSSLPVSQRPLTTTGLLYNPKRQWYGARFRTDVFTRGCCAIEFHAFVPA